jgi:hypothetical protein
MTVTDKNIAVLSGQDSLHTTFKRAMDAFKNGWNVPQAPYPPKTFNVTSHHARIDLSWTPNNDGPEIKGYELYRNTLEKVDGYVSNSWFSKYELIAELSADANTFTDTTQKYSEDYYYYIVAVGDEVAANNELKIPAHKLKSNRSYTQTYLFAQKLIVSVNNKNEIPTEYKLEQNYPNPFNPTTTINYSIPKKGIVQLNVYDALGREVATLINKEQSVGNYKIDFNAASLTSGIYFYRLQSGSFTQTKKLILLR